MRCPIIDKEGHTYERNEIIKCIEVNGKSPITTKPLRLEDLRPNKALFAVIFHAITTTQAEDRFAANSELRDWKQDIFSLWRDRSNQAYPGRVAYDLEAPLPPSVEALASAERSGTLFSFLFDPLPLTPPPVEIEILCTEIVGSPSNITISQEASPREEEGGEEEVNPQVRQRELARIYIQEGLSCLCISGFLLFLFYTFWLIGDVRG